MNNTVCENPCLWQPQEILDIGNDCQCGIAVDDHCYVVLTKNIVGSWTPSKWIPLKVAKRLGEISRLASSL